MEFRRIVIATTASVAAGFASVALAGPASAEVIDRAIGVANCPEPQTQICTPIPTVGFDTTGPMWYSFTASNGHCSEMTEHTFLDGVELTQHNVNPGQVGTEMFLELTPGHHTIGVQAEGMTGGCNIGKVVSWAGTVHIETDQDALNAKVAHGW